MNLYYESDLALLSALLILLLWQYMTDKRFNTEKKAFCLVGCITNSPVHGHGSIQS